MLHAANVYRILWRHESLQQTVSAACFDTVTESVRVADLELAARKTQGAEGYDIIWAGSGVPLPDWYRQSCMDRGE